MGDLLFAIALITTIQGGQSVGTATGFFYVRNEVVYLVTNRHVVIDETKQLRPDTLRLRLHTDARDLTKNVERDVPLYSSGRPRWHAHPDYSTRPIDIAVVSLDQLAFRSGVFIKALDESIAFPDKYVMAPGEDVMVIGFPRGVSDRVHNLPLVRSALVSSAYGVDFNATPSFVVDANLHPGMSGSPVLTRPKNMWPKRDGGTDLLGNAPVYFVGVFSGTLSVAVSPTKSEALGLGQVWYGQLVNEIIDAIRPKA